MTQLQFDNENIIQELHKWKNKCIRLEKEYNNKCQEDCNVSHFPINKPTKNVSQDESFLTLSLSTSTLNDELVDQIGNLAVENGRLINENDQLSNRCKVLEQEYHCSLDAHKMDIDNSRMTIESMKVENHNQRASLIERDKKTAELIRYLQRCSFLCTTYSSTTPTSSDVLNDDNIDDDENDNDDIKKEYETPQTMNDTSIELAKH